MADNIRCDEVVERFGLTAVPGAEEMPDNSLVLFCRCAHGNSLSVIVAACTMTRRRSLAFFGHHAVICGWPSRFEDKKGPTQLVFLMFYWPTIKSVGDRGHDGTTEWTARAAL